MQPEIGPGAGGAWASAGGASVGVVGLLLKWAGIFVVVQDSGCTV